MPEDREQGDVWIPSACCGCFSFCPIRAHKVNGVVTKIEGNPDDPLTQGRICARGLSSINMLYDPNRLDYPVKRTNPEKGIGVDPRWERISWDEALDTITEKLKAVREDDPRKLCASFGVNGGAQFRVLQSFARAFGSPNVFVGGAGNHCGAAKHFIEGLTHAAWVCQPDFNYCNYFLNFGVPVGTGAYYGVTAAVRKMAAARSRGMKHVVLDPWKGMPAQGADEWVPIRPGTDGAVALAMANVLVNELGIMDDEYLRHDTNAPYLVKEDGRYLRDADGKPQMWNGMDGRPKPYDAELTAIVLDVDEMVDGQRVRSAFNLLKEHVKAYTAEVAAEISDVPAETIRRLAREIGDAALIGETIEIEGEVFPFRPVAIAYFRAVAAHRHGSLSCMAIELLMAILGIRAVPGSFIGMNSRSVGDSEIDHPQWTPSEGPDGLLVTGRWARPESWPWPPIVPQKPQDLNLSELIPPSYGNSPMMPLVGQMPEEYGIDYKPTVHLMLATNFLMTVSDPEVMQGFFKKVFTVNFNLFLDESAELSDIVLPDASFLERLDLQADWFANGCATDHWSYPLRQKVIEPIGERRQATAVLLEIADRLGMRAELNQEMNGSFSYRGPHLLEGDTPYTVEELTDRRYKSLLGNQFGLDFMKEHGLVAWPKKLEEVYWHHYVKCRIPVYFEHLLGVKERLEQIQKETGLFGDLDLDDYQPVPDWRPCASHTETRPGFDLTAVYFRLPYQSFTMTGNNGWIDEVSMVDPYAESIVINAATARKKGVKTGDWLQLESAATGQTVRGKARLTEAVHPEVVVVSGHGGHWARGLPLASKPGKGVNFNRLLKQDFDHMDTPSLNLDLCVKVKVTKVAGP
jgi:anaerobic selenocysteine-containing dehydrogenase